MMTERNIATDRAASPPGRSPGRWLRVGISLLVVLHLGAVFVAPLAVEPTSELALALRRFYQPYIEANDLNHGYKFFAPDPGPSHLVEYELAFDDGRAAQFGTYPNLDRQTPRLLYHRHFMMTEALNWMYAPAKAPEEFKDDPTAIRQWQARRDVFDSYVQSWADHLRTLHGAASVKLTLVRHHLASPEEVKQGRRLNQKDYYERLVIYPAEGTSL
jgi:hypothetical protein